MRVSSCGHNHALPRVGHVHQTFSPSTSTTTPLWAVPPPSCHDTRSPTANARGSGVSTWGARETGVTPRPSVRHSYPDVTPSSRRTVIQPALTETTVAMPPPNSPLTLSPT